MAFLISCGGDDGREESAMQEQTQQTQTEASTEKMDYPDQQPPVIKNPNIEGPPKQTHPSLPKTEPVHANDLEEGTCEYAAYMFAEYFTMGDSSAVLPMCTDSMKWVVRELYKDTTLVRNMKLNRKAGYTITEISTAVQPDRPSADCQACMTATLWGETREDCNFYFVNRNGEWLLSGFE